MCGRLHDRGGHLVQNEPAGAEVLEGAGAGVHRPPPRVPRRQLVEAALPGRRADPARVATRLPPRQLAGAQLHRCPCDLNQSGSREASGAEMRTGTAEFRVI